VGAKPPADLLSCNDGESVTVTGYLEHPGPLLASSDLFVAPWITGTGIKIKVLEAMASGVPVVANAIAMQGIPAQAERDYLHAESADEFAEQVIRLMRDAALRASVASSAERLMEAHFSLADALDRQRGFIEKLAGSGRSFDEATRRAGRSNAHA